MSNEVSAAKRHPFDIHELTKGMSISPQECEEAAGVSAAEDFKSYQLRLLAFCQRIEDEAMAVHGERWTVKAERGGIRILTDEEASDYNAALFAGRLRAMRKIYRRSAGVDPSGLSENTRQLHERRVLAQGSVLSAVQERMKRDALMSTIFSSQALCAGRADSEGDE